MSSRTLITLGVLALLVGGCTRTHYKPSKFAQEFDPGKVIESILARLAGVETNSPANAAGVYAQYGHHSYIRIFNFEPVAKENDVAALLSNLKTSIDTDLRSEGLTTEFKPTPAGDLSVSYKSDERSGTVHIFTTPTARGSFRVVGVVHECPQKD